jgi:hypothetical protein
VKQNLTLTLDSDLLRAARKVALDRDTSINQMVRDYLAQLVDEKDRHKEAVKKLRKIFRESTYEIGQKTWTRDELYDRSL